MFVLTHGCSIDVENDRLATPRADFGCCRFIGGQMNVISRPLLQTAGSYAFDECSNRPVIQSLWRFGFFELQIHARY